MFIINKIGDNVNQDDDLLFIEATKMEHTIKGLVSEMSYHIGEVVDDDQILAAIQYRN